MAKFFSYFCSKLLEMWICRFRRDLEDENKYFNAGKKLTINLNKVVFAIYVHINYVCKNSKVFSLQGSKWRLWYQVKIVSNRISNKIGLNKYIAP